MFNVLMTSSLFILMLTILLNIYRVIKGPTRADRVLALDAIGINLIAGIAIYSVLQDTRAYFDLILIIGILSFIGTIAFARYMERGSIIERKR